MRNKNLYCKAVALRGLPETIRKLGGNPERLFAQAGLNMAHIKSHNYYDWEKICDLFIRIDSTLNEPSLGIKFAYDVPKDFLNSGPMLLLVALVPTLRDFFDLSVKYQPLHINSFTYHYLEYPDLNEVGLEARVHPLSPPCYQFVEHMLSLIHISEPTRPY